MNNDIARPSFLHRLRKFFASFLWISALRRNTVPVDENHLEGNRRVFLSPMTQASRLLAMFQRDPNFVESLPSDYEHHLVVLAVVGDQLRANVYRLEEDRALQPSFNGLWMSQGLFPYYLNKEQDEVSLLTRNTFPHLRYNPYFVETSYARFMTQAEEDELEGTWIRDSRRSVVTPSAATAG